MALPKSFFKLIETSNKPVLVDFWAAWCGPCKMVSPVVERIARDLKGKLLTVKINVDEKQHVASRYQVTAIPTIMLFWRGASVMRIQGAQPYEAMMSQIRANWPAGGPPL